MISTGHIFAASIVALGLVMLPHHAEPVDCNDPLVQSSFRLVEDCTRTAVNPPRTYEQGLNTCESIYGGSVRCVVEKDRDGLAQFSDPQSKELVRRYTEWLIDPVHESLTLDPNH